MDAGLTISPAAKFLSLSRRVFHTSNPSSANKLSHAQPNTLLTSLANKLSHAQPNNLLRSCPFGLSARQCRLLVLCCTDCQGSCQTLPGTGTPRLDVTCELCQERQQEAAGGPHSQRKKQGSRRGHGPPHTDVVIPGLVDSQVLTPTSDPGPHLGCPWSVPIPIPIPGVCQRSHSCLHWHGAASKHLPYRQLVQQSVTRDVKSARLGLC